MASKFVKDDIDLDDNKLWKEFERLNLAPDVNMKKIKKEFNMAQSIKLLIIGKTGTGKSTLVNGIIGARIAEEGYGLLPMTSEVTAFERVVNGVEVTVWDSPGLQDGTSNQDDYLRQMKEKCIERDLTLFCINVSDRRFVQGEDNPDVITMKKFTETFTVDFWKSAIVVLTFANELQHRVEYMDKPPEEKIKAQNEILQKWNDQIRKIIQNDCSVPTEIAEKIEIVPAGHYKDIHLPVRKYWLSNLWRKCLNAITTTEEKVALVKVNVFRLKNEKDVKDEDFEQKPENQPIVVNRWGSTTLNSLLIGLDAAAAVTKVLKELNVPYTKELYIGCASLATIVGFISNYYEDR